MRKFSLDRINGDWTCVTLNLYMCALAGTIPEIVPDIDARIRTKKPASLQNVPANLLKRRIRRGDSVFTAYVRGRVVGYLFAARESAWIGEIDTRLRIQSEDVYFYDAFTCPQFRGKHIYTWLLACTARHYRQQGYERALIFTTSANHASRKAIRRAGFSCYQRIRYYDAWGLKMWHYTPKKYHVRSYCAIEN